MHFSEEKNKNKHLRANKAPIQKMTLPFFNSFIDMQKVHGASKYSR